MNAPLPLSSGLASITTGLAPLVDPDTVPDEAEAPCLFDLGDGVLDGGNHQAHQTPLSGQHLRSHGNGSAKGAPVRSPFLYVNDRVV